MRLIRRFVPLALFASVFATGIPLAPASQMKVDVSTSSVQVTGANVTQQESHLLSRSVVSDDGKLRSANASTMRTAPPGFRAQVENPNHGQMVGFVWNGPVSASLEVRTQGSTGWTEWTPADSEDGPDPQQNTVKPGIGPLWIGDDAADDRSARRRGSLADLRVDTLHMDVQGNVNGIDSRGCRCRDAAHHLARRVGCRAVGIDHIRLRFRTRQRAARLAVVHHTDTSNNYSPAEAFGIVKSIQTFEIGSRGFCDISYNFLVDRYGQIFEGRTNSVYQTPIGGHARGFNTGSIGVALIGQYQTGEPIPAASVPGVQYNALRDLLAWKFWWNGIDALVVRLHDQSVLVRRRLPQLQVARRDTGGAAGDRRPPGRDEDVLPGEPRRTVAPEAPRRCRGAGRHGRAVLSARRDPLAAGRLRTRGRDARRLRRDAPGGRGRRGAAHGLLGLVDRPRGRGHAGRGLRARRVGRGAAVRIGAGARGVGLFHGLGHRPRRSRSTRRAPAATCSTDGAGCIRSGSAPPASAGYWYGWDIARDVALLPGGSGGYVLDGWGGVHVFGSAPPVNDEGYWYGWDIARSIALNPGGPGGYVLDGWGGVHAFGGAPAVGISNYDPTVNHTDLVMLSGGRGYVLDACGYVWQVGSAPAVDVSMTFNGYNIGRSLVASG